MSTTWAASFAAVSSATAFLSSERENKDESRQTKNQLKQKSHILTLDAFLRLLQQSLCGIRLLLECGQGGLLFLEASLRTPNGRLLLSKGGIPLSEGRKERGDGRLLTLELGLTALELGLLPL